MGMGMTHTQTIETQSNLEPPHPMYRSNAKNMEEISFTLTIFNRTASIGCTIDSNFKEEGENTL